MNKVAARKVSFLRPIPLPRHAESFFRWMQNQPFQDVGYITDMDMDDYNAIKRSSMLIIPGHSEYWTLQARKNFDRFVEEGNHAVVLSGNTMWWQVRYNKERNQVICYRQAKDDPIHSSKLKTILWNDVTLNYPILQSLGTDFSLAGYGLKEDKGWNGYKIMARSPLLENTLLQKNQILPLPSDELDGAPIAGFNNDIPILDRQALGFYKIEIIGFDLVSRQGKDGVATWIVFQSTKSSGIVINTASTNWCADNGIGVNSDIRKITFNMINKLVLKENVFSPDIDDKSLPALKPVLN
jgi:hypothetical protein